MIIAEEEKYHDGDVIYQQGSSGDWIYEVLSGSVEISRSVGKQEIVLERLGPGDVFGEVSFFAKSGRVTTARAVGETKVGVIDRELLDREYNRLSEDFKVLMVATANKVKKVVDRASEFTLRKEPRVEKILPVMFKSGNEMIKGYLTNISTWGLFVGTDKPLEPGKRFGLTLRFPGVGKPVNIKGEVVWTRGKKDEAGRPPGMGVTFRDVDVADYNILKTYIEEQGKDKPDD